MDAAQRTGADLTGALDGLELHVDEWGLGSISETTDGDAPHAATGCPFQAWSVAEVLRARRALASRVPRRWRATARPSTTTTLVTPHPPTV